MHMKVAMTIPQSAKNESPYACPFTDNNGSSFSHSQIRVRKIKQSSLIIYLNERANLTGHLKLKVLSWVHFSMVMFSHK
jgi:hypothetical protein